MTGNYMDKFSHEKSVDVPVNVPLQNPIHGHFCQTGWWLVYPSEKYEFVNWDHEIPNISGNIKFMATSHHQPGKKKG